MRWVDAPSEFGEGAFGELGFDFRPDDGMLLVDEGEDRPVGTPVPLGGVDPWLPLRLPSCSALAVDRGGPCPIFTFAVVNPPRI